LIYKPNDQPEYINRRLILYRQHLADVRSFYKDIYKKCVMNDGVYVKTTEMLIDLAQFCKLEPITVAPCIFKAVLGGYPGSGRQEVAEMIATRYNRVHSDLLY
jgi:hypothetical protein